MNGSSAGNQLFNLGAGTYDLFSNPLYTAGTAVNLIALFSDMSSASPLVVPFPWPNLAVPGTIIYSQGGADAFTLSTTGITNADRMSFGNGSQDAPFHPDGTNDVVLQLQIGTAVDAGTPEPATWGAMLAGLALLAGKVRLSRRA